MEQNKKYTPDDVSALVLNMRYCSGDIKVDIHDECTNHCDVCMNGETRRCFQLLMSTAADLIEGLYAQLEKEREMHEYTYLHTEAFRKEIEALKAKYEADE